MLPDLPAEALLQSPGLFRSLLGLLHTSDPDPEIDIQARADPRPSRAATPAS